MIWYSDIIWTLHEWCWYIYTSMHLSHRLKKSDLRWSMQNNTCRLLAADTLHSRRELGVFWLPELAFVRFQTRGEKSQRRIIPGWCKWSVGCRYMPDCFQPLSPKDGEEWSGMDPSRSYFVLGRFGSCSDRRPLLCFEATMAKGARGQLSSFGPSYQRKTISKAASMLWLCCAKERNNG